MRVVLFCHSLRSDWNHGNAHFLRGVMTELRLRGHEAEGYEPWNAWSVRNMVADHGAGSLDAVQRAYPLLRTTTYEATTLDLDGALDGADLVLVHEWNTRALIQRIGRHRKRGGRYLLLFHDTHHRSVTAPAHMERIDLSGYDGVLAYGERIRERYLAEGWTRRAWTWHEAADTRVFQPMNAEREGDLIWIGNWGDDERTKELQEFLLEPSARLRLRTCVRGVRYPPESLAALRRAGIRYGGWLANYEVPQAFAKYRVTVHVPRRPYVEALPGIPTIRPFEALACGIPLVSAPWDDAERLFRTGVDYLMARNGAEMRRYLRDVLEDRALADSLAAKGRETILARHTCTHRVSELLDIYDGVRGVARERTDVA